MKNKLYFSLCFLVSSIFLLSTSLFKSQNWLDFSQKAVITSTAASQPAEQPETAESSKSSNTTRTNPPLKPGNSRVLGSPSAVKPSTESSKTADLSEERVYISTYGDCYHRSSICSGMRTAREVTLSEAIESGRRPCETCYE